MAVLAAVVSGTGAGAGEGRLPWPVFLLTLAAVASSYLSALSLYQLVTLRAEIEGLKLDFCRWREEGQGQTENISSRRSTQELLHRPGSQRAFSPIRTRRSLSGAETIVTQPCLQLLANSSRKTYSKEISSRQHTGIPWQAGLKRGYALEVEGDRILVRQEGYYFVYSQVDYRERIHIMGHVVIRWKSNVVGNESSHVFLFRCIQTMNLAYAFNTCYTGGIVKLEVGDYLELLIPRPTATVLLEGDSTFLGALKLA